MVKQLKIFSAVACLVVMASLLLRADFDAFGDGFESGDTTAWTGQSGTTVDSNQPAHGTYAARFLSGGSSVYVYKTLSTAATNGDTAYFRIYFRPDSLPATNVRIAWFLSSGYAVQFSLRYRGDLSPKGFDLFSDKFSTILLNTTGTYNSATYYCLAARVTVTSTSQTGNAELKTYNLAGTLLEDVTSTVSSATWASSFNWVYWDAGDQASSSGLSWYGDDFAINSTGWIGPVSARRRQVVIIDSH